MYEIIYSGFLTTLPEIIYNNDINNASLIEEVLFFRNKTNINGLVFSSINSHNQDIKQDLNVMLIEELANKIPEIFLVLHDNVTINDQQLTLAIKAGITKVNISSDLRKVYINSLKASFKLNPQLTDITTLIANAITAMQKFAEEKIIILGANNQNKF